MPMPEAPCRARKWGGLMLVTLYEKTAS